MLPTQVRRLPRDAVAAGLDVDGGDKRVRRARSILVLADLPVFQRIRMKERGGQLTVVQDVAEAVRVLAERDFDAAIIDMNAPGGGTALVKSIKAGVGSINPLQTLVADEMAAVSDTPRPPSAEDLARERHRLTPFFLVMQGEQQYAIVVSPPEHSYLEDGTGIGLSDAVMCLDIGKLLLRGSAMA